MKTTTTKPYAVKLLLLFVCLSTLNTLGCHSKIREINHSNPTIEQRVSPLDTSTVNRVFQQYQIDESIDTSCCLLKATSEDFCDIKPAFFPNCCPEDLFSRGHNLNDVGGQYEMMFGSAFTINRSACINKVADEIQHSIVYSIVDDCENIPHICKAMSNYDCATASVAPVKIMTLMYKNGVLLAPENSNNKKPSASVKLLRWDKNAKIFKQALQENHVVQHDDYNLTCTDFDNEPGKAEHICSALLQVDIAITDRKQLSVNDEYVIVTYIAEHENHDHAEVDNFPPVVNFKKKTPDLTYFYDLIKNAPPEVVEHVDIIPLPVQGTKTCAELPTH